jgi:hypothetical protein
MSDMVNSPSHYNQSNIECIDSIRAALGEEGFIAYCRGNAIKYNWRAGHKSDAKEDLQKAAWYSRMASGDDPRYRASAPNLGPTDEALTKVVNQAMDHYSNFDPSNSKVEGYVPPECDDRPVSGRVVKPPCDHDPHYDAYDKYPTCRKCGTQVP